MSETTSGGVRIHYLDDGSGIPALMIHGHTVDLRMWDDLLPMLRAVGLRPIRYDLRGHGKSRRPDTGYHWSHHAADAVAVLDAVGVERAAVIGTSIGGGIALELALTEPERVDRLVLMSPVMPDRPFEEVFFDNLRRVASVIRSDGVRAAMAGPWMESPLWGGSLEVPGVRERLEALVSDFPGAEYLATARDHVDRGWRVPERLSEIASPTLILVGSNELPSFYEYAREAADGISGARLELLEGCGHMLALEAAGRVAPLIVEHLLADSGAMTE
jgi:pimeloyl-ACP methyl ester carboxylesterase